MKKLADSFLKSKNNYRVKGEGVSTIFSDLLIIENSINNIHLIIVEESFDYYILNFYNYNRKDLYIFLEKSLLTIENKKIIYKHHITKKKSILINLENCNYNEIEFNKLKMNITI